MRCNPSSPISPPVRRPSPASAPRERRAPSGGRLARLAVLDPEQPRQALAFLSGYRPRVFDAILDAVEPPARPSPEDSTDREPFCARCGAPIGIFLAHGQDYRHYAAS